MRLEIVRAKNSLYTKLWGHSQIQLIEIWSFYLVAITARNKLSPAVG